MTRVPMTRRERILRSLAIIALLVAVTLHTPLTASTTLAVLRRFLDLPRTRRSRRTVRWSPPLGSPERAHLPEGGAVPLIPSLRREEDPLLAPLSLQV